MIKLGYAETDITPETPLQLVGFNRTDNTSRGVETVIGASVDMGKRGPSLPDHN